MAFKITFPAVYERVTRWRTDEEVERDMNARFSGGDRSYDCVSADGFSYNSTPSTPLAAPPQEVTIKGGATIGRVPRPSTVIAPECPPISAKKAATQARQAACIHSGHWYMIGPSKTPGKVRRRCAECRIEQTIPDTNLVGSEYRSPRRQAGKALAKKKKVKVTHVVATPGAN